MGSGRVPGYDPYGLAGPVGRAPAASRQPSVWSGGFVTHHRGGPRSRGGASRRRFFVVTDDHHHRVLCGGCDRQNVCRPTAACRQRRRLARSAGRGRPARLWTLPASGGRASVALTLLPCFRKHGSGSIVSRGVSAPGMFAQVCCVETPGPRERAASRVCVTFRLFSTLPVCLLPLA